MNKLSLIVLASSLVVTGAVQAQNASEKELPSAPSATLEQQMRRQRPPAPPPSQAAPQKPQEPTPAPANVEAVAKTADPEPKAATPGPSSPSADQPANDSSFIFKKSVDLVNVIFTVTDKHGKFIKNLKESDFKVLDNRQPPEAIKGFKAESDLPLRVGLLVDASNSVRDRFTFEQEAAIEFLNQIIRPRSDKAFVIGFDTTAEVTQDMTDSTEKLSRGVRALHAGGGTALYDALYYACRDKLLKTDQNTSVRKAIILLSDGEDNQSRVTREETIEMAQRAEVIIYAISTNISGVKLHGDKVLERMADATGGRAFFPFKIQEVSTAFSEIQDELRSQYQLAYKPAGFKADGLYHSIDIMAENHKNLKVRARKGYFAPKQ
jgi:VWFA-related protein